MSLSPASPRFPLRSLARASSPVAAEAAAAHAHWLAGRPRLQAASSASRPLAGSPRALWLAPRTPPREDRRPRGGRGMGGREDACAVGAAGPCGAERREWEGGKGGPALTVYFKVTSPSINSCGHRPAPESRRRRASAAFYRCRGGGARGETWGGDCGAG